MIATSDHDLKQLEEFLELLRDGTGPLNACYAVGWTPHHLRQKMKDPEFQALVAEANERKIETVEQRVFEASAKGNFAASQFILLCQAADRGWRPPQQRVAINGEARIKVEVVEATKDVIRAQLAARQIKSLQPVVDADVVNE